MSQKNWAKYFLSTGKPENTEIGWSPGEASGRISPAESFKRYEEMSTPPSSPKASANIFAASYKSAEKSRKRRGLCGRRRSTRGRRN